MKALALLLFQLLATLSYSQANWFPTDARWTYSWAAFGGWGYVSMEVLPGDTLLGNQLYKKVLIIMHPKTHHIIDKVKTRIGGIFIVRQIN